MTMVAPITVTFFFKHGLTVLSLCSNWAPMWKCQIKSPDEMKRWAALLPHACVIAIDGPFLKLFTKKEPRGIMISARKSDTRFRVGFQEGGFGRFSFIQHESYLVKFTKTCKMYTFVDNVLNTIYS